MLPSTEHAGSQDEFHVTVLRKMLRRERLAISACATAESAVHATASRDVIARILDDHQKSLRILKDWLGRASDPEKEDSASVTTISELEALGCMAREETLGERFYRGSLENADLDDRFRFLIASTFLPGCQRNRALLERAIAGLESVPVPMPAAFPTPAIAIL